MSQIDLCKDNFIMIGKPSLKLEIIKDYLFVG
jgi:hypothetical protein